MIKSDYYSLYRSIKYFLKLLFIKQKYDVIFVSANEFNRGENKDNLFFKPFLETCDKNNINYIVFEETDLKGAFNHYPRNPNSIPLDFISIIRTIIRIYFKIFYKNRDDFKIYYQIEVKIAKILKMTLLRKLDFDNCIYVPGDMGIFWHGINPEAVHCELQHGIIYDGHPSYLIEGKASQISKIKNDVLLVFGNGFQNLLIKQDQTNYYNQQNIISIGKYFPKHILFNEKRNNKVILFSLQITPEFSYETSISVLNVIENILELNKFFLENNGYKIIFKHHPRYNIKDCPSVEFKYSFVSFADNSMTLSELIDESSIHCTFFSTIAFDAAMYSVPTLFLNHNILSNSLFFEQYEYPIPDFNIIEDKDFKLILRKLENLNEYSQCSRKSYKWARYFYEEYHEEKFIELIKKEI